MELHDARSPAEDVGRLVVRGAGIISADEPEAKPKYINGNSIAWRALDID
jgi:hypothetical protein